MCHFIHAKTGRIDSGQQCAVFEIFRYFQEAFHLFVAYALPRSSMVMMNWSRYVCINRSTFLALSSKYRMV